MLVPHASFCVGPTQFNTEKFLSFIGFGILGFCLCAFENVEPKLIERYSGQVCSSQIQTHLGLQPFDLCRFPM